MTDITPTSLSGVVIIEPKRFGDERGFFRESWIRKTFEALGVDVDFVQDNHSLSKQVGTVRGLHFQTPPHAQAKLVRCGKGRLLDVAVDIRKGSPTYGQWVAEELSFDNGRQLFIPAGFGHGFVTLEPDTEIIYKCSDYYAPDCDRSLQFDDPEIGIDWGVTRDAAVLSEKDRIAPSLADLDNPFTWEDTK
jgi:dTDP-4-dehydrorhamnose 3,5-epimerase